MLSVFLFLLSACGGPAATDPLTGTTGGTGGTTTTTQNVDCDTGNEACDVGTCDGNGSEMLPGANCINCHVEGGDPGAPAWTAAGTVFKDIDGSKGLKGAIVRITDSVGTVRELISNDVGNFYNTTDLIPPLTAEIEKGGQIVKMSREVQHGACNACHACDGTAGGKLYGPNSGGQAR